MSVKVNVTSNFPQIAGQLESVSKDLETKYPIYVRQCAANICHELLRRSYPAVGNDPSSLSGGTDGAIKQGEANIRKDVNQMFGAVSDLRVGDLLMAGRSDLLSNLNNPIEWRSDVLKLAWERGDYKELFHAFQTAGWQAGEINYAEAPTLKLQATMRSPQTGLLKKPVKKVYVRSQEHIESFIQERLKAVGKMAGGWVQCLRALGRSPSNNMNGNGEGSVDIYGSGSTYGVVATNKYGDFNSMLSKTGMAQGVVQEEALRFTERVREMVANSFKSQMGKSVGGTSIAKETEGIDNTGGS